MGRRDLLSAEERRHLFGAPTDRDAMARLYTLGSADVGLIEARREERNRLGFAVQLALIRRPGLTLAQIAAQPGVDLEPLVGFIAEQLELPLAALTDYAAREQTMTDHAREIGGALGVRPPVRTDLSIMIEAAASAAWSTDKGASIASAVVAALREKAIMLPAPAAIERAGITGRATARKRVHEDLLTGHGPGPGHRAPQQGEAMFGEVHFNRRAEGRRIRRRDALLAHQRPSRVAIEEAPRDTIDGCSRQERGQFVNRLQGVPPPDTWLR